LLDKLNELKASLKDEFAKERMVNKSSVTPPSAPPSPPRRKVAASAVAVAVAAPTQRKKKEAIKSPVRKRMTMSKRTKQATKNATPKRAKRTKKRIPTPNELELLAFFDPSNPLLCLKKKATAPSSSPPPPPAPTPAPTPVEFATLSPPMEGSTAQNVTTPNVPSPDQNSKAPKRQALTPYEKQLKSQLSRRNTQIELLKNQLIAHGDAPIEEVVSLEEANTR
jgi:hypothetical protein